MNQNLNRLRDIVKSLSKDVLRLVKDASEGNLSTRADVTRYSGDWASLVSEMNGLMETIAAPIGEAAEVLGNVSAGAFDKLVKGDYKGEFKTIKDSVNTTVTNVASYIEEIARVLSSLADNNLDQEITREYVGSFVDIKNALNHIISTLNRVIGEIMSGADQVAAGAKQISESSMSLAQGATEQASSVEQLTATVMSVNEKTQNNADNSRHAAGLSDELKNFAVEGNKQMKEMLKSMDSINEASTSISKIIEIIKDISFQTNLLALNASIEAAHAGVHGAGFSVVADEVRSLAVKSQEAASNTTELIETSIKRVNEGASIAAKTDAALEKIVNGASEVSGIINGISSDSNEQAYAISQINEGVSQIAQVVQNNSATSEESASASQELSSQSDLMRELVKSFKLK